MTIAEVVCLIAWAGILEQVTIIYGSLEKAMSMTQALRPLFEEL